ncbi:hypothetical protein JHN61_07670 [Streptomyces sp. MBT67]|uniref:DUF5691 domain-containing protein n=1 Tax=unclassified Streptomyces TaxID=2593676 RepID=UPI00190C224B|nr:MULTISPECIES: DUF5691 domain-containing protein [unclassified Streptomyces]MBK3529282.1 hypothetical protein [Streptomyces sp. MBT72]MBK3536088.1 hypothetical protein [Streptomyces sp. MBT67]MBK3553244.1 hypothetical protein [Streptomyces sp. MBT61]MBK6028704.1 hypothetical protein [Streptomyces sp. MBT59]
MPHTTSSTATTTGTTTTASTSASASVDSLPWEELVTSALLGTDRRPPAPRGGPVPADAPAALLDAAALHTVRRRAGLLPAVPEARPEPAAPDPRPALPEAARHRLAHLLADRSAPSGGGRRGTAPDLTELIPQWLAIANRRGFRAPADLLPALLDAARARTDLRPQALAFAGPRGMWLAGLNPDWKFALRGSASGAPQPGLADPDAVARLWEEGLFAERVALLDAVRAQDPPAALTLLATTWPTERAEDRLMFLDSLRSGLGGADEPFLEQALSDRSRNVRATAAELLSALPESALAGRMAARALSCVHPDRTGAVASIAVEAPHECDADMQRDGVTAVPPTGRGERSWWLGQLVEATPLGVWEERFGGRAADEIVALPVADDWADELHTAWCRAAVRQRNPQWSRALLGRPSEPVASGAGTASIAERSKLLAILDEGERASWVAEFIAAHGLSEAFQLLGVCTVPWAGPLGRAVVDALDIARDGGSYPWSFSGVMGLAERCLDPAEADRLEVLTAAQDEQEDASPGAGGYWSEAFQRLVSTLRLRAAMEAELMA